MSSERHYRFPDRLILQADALLRTLLPSNCQASRPSPAHEEAEDNTLSAKDKQHIAGLMRVNHTGEVCAQALYQGQALTARNTEIRQSMEQAAKDEIDHLVWCRERIRQLESHTSILNPLFYTLSFALGAGAGVISDKISLGFVAATEEQVCKHLEQHLAQIPATDQKSRTILKQMRIDEEQHATNALALGGHHFPAPIKTSMSLIAKVMTTSTYNI